MSDKELDKLKKIELEILDYFVDICKKNNLKYYLAYGTLLGAVRHKGFIPWDDDIDVFMPPEDYIKLLELFQNNDKFFMQNVNTELYYYTIFSKIRMNHTCMIETKYKDIKIHKGINIDIFPMYPYPSLSKDRRKFEFEFRITQMLLTRNLAGDSFKNKIIAGFLKIIPAKCINNIAKNTLDKLLKYDKEYHQYKTETNNIILDKEWFNKEIILPFEDREYVVPKDYDKVLTSLYGDYMVLPKEEDRVGHGMGDIILSFDKDYEELNK